MEAATRKAALFLLSLERELAREVLARLPDEDRRAVARTMAGFAGSMLPEREVESVLEEFRAGLEEAAGAAAEVEQVHGLLAEALGEEARGLLAETERRRRVEEARGTLERLDGETLAFVLSDEHPQARAALLLALGPEAAARALPHFPQEEQKELVERMIGLKMPAEEVVERMMLAAAQKARRVPRLVAPIDEEAHLKAVATVLNKFDEETRKAVLDSIEAADADRAQKVREQLFTFEDLLKLGPRDIQRILSGIDTRVLALALKGASPEIADLILSNVSSRVRDRIEEERETLGAVRLSEVRQAQSEMAAVARDLIQRGEIVFGGGGDELVE